MGWRMEMEKNYLEPKLYGWKAKWIWKRSAGGCNEFAYMRKEFGLLKKIASAMVYASAQHHFELHINGIKVSGYVTPAPTHPEKSKYYLSYDITDIIKADRICFSSAVHYLGGDGQNYVNGLPGFILQCSVEYEDGSTELLISDETWKVLGETPFRNGTAYQQNRKISAIEDYDARREPEGWREWGFDDSSWDWAEASAINEAVWNLKPQPIPEGEIREILVPVPVGIQREGFQVFDAGKIVTGWPRLTLTGVEGIRIQLRYSEDLEEDGSVKHNVANETSENYYDLYTMKGEEVESWEPALSYKAFRYVEVSGYPELLGPGTVSVVSAGTGLTYKGSFNSSNELLNKIYKACIQTQQNNVVGQMVDCPHREQAQYLADSDLQAETFIYSFSEKNVLKKVLQDFTDAQNEDGTLPFVFPTNVENSEFNIKIPEWDLHYITLLWKIYYAYNDLELLQECYDTAQKIVRYYIGILDEERHLIPRAEGFPVGWNISDWPYPDIDETGSFLTVQNCLFQHVLGRMSQIALLLGLQEDAAEFSAVAALVKEAVQQHLYLPEQGLFCDSYDSRECHQGTQVVAYQYGLVPQEDREKVLEFIAGQGFGCSTLLSLNLLQVLFENGKGSLAYSFLNRVEQPGWGYMIDRGYQTIWEGFQNIESHCHAWNAYPARVLAEYVVGIRAAAPGFREAEIKPFFAEGLDFAEAGVPAGDGILFVRWERRGEKAALTVRLPEGIAAAVFLPWSSGGEAPRKVCGEGEYVFTS